MKATHPILARAIALVSVSCGLISSVFAEPVQIASGGEALLPIVVSANANSETREAANELARLLSEISGASFSVSSGDGKSGIVVGSISDFPEAEEKGDFDPSDLMRQEEYRLRSHRNGLNVIGASSLGARHAVWGLLHRLGYRQFFPGKNWEYVPRQGSLSVDVDEKQAPAFAVRSIWYQYGTYRPKNVLADWLKKNRAGAGFHLRTNHSYGGIINRNKAVFEGHPEYLALVKGERWPMKSKLAKFCIGNPDLRKLVVEDALAQMETISPRPSSISIDPNDGGYWCQCEECAKLGSQSDQQVFLANQVAEAVTERYPGTRVGMYAYYLHSTPPTIPVHPAVVVSIATQLTTGGLNSRQLAEGWKKQGADIGTRDYFSIWTWNRGLPGSARSANPQALGEWIRNWSKMGSRFMTAESADDWGPCGLGYYVAARTLWDPQEADRFNEIYEDFLEKAFGSAKGPMSEFYRLINGKRVPNSEDKIARMYRILEDARNATTEDAVIKRIDDLTLYTRYVELYWAYHLAPAGEERQKAYETMVAFALRITDTGMVASLAVHRDLPARDKTIVLAEENHWKKRKTNPWMQWEPFTDSEIAEIRKAGINRNKLVNFQTVMYSENLVPAAALGSLPSVTPGAYGSIPRSRKSLFTWVPPGKQSISLRSKAARLHRLYAVSEDGEELMSEVDRSDERTRKEVEEREIHLTTTSQGLHRIEIEGGTGPSQIEWDEGMPITVNPESNSLTGAYELYFYVPKGTTVIGGHALRAGRGSVFDSRGNQAFSFTDMPEKGGHFEIPVPKGQDGTFWKLTKQSNVRFLTVPSYLARTPQELLLPKEVVEADARKQR